MSSDTPNIVFILTDDQGVWAAGRSRDTASPCPYNIVRCRACIAGPVFNLRAIVPILRPHGKRLTAFYPCDDGLAPCRRAVLKNMAAGVLPWEKTITHRVEAEEAPALYERIEAGAAPDVIGAVVNWS